MAMSVVVPSEVGVAPGSTKSDSDSRTKSVVSRFIGTAPILEGVDETLQ